MNYSWTQPCCYTCWTERHPNREPVRIKNVEAEICVYCGAHTEYGIYIRIDPNTAKYPTITKD